MIAASVSSTWWRVFSATAGGSGRLGGARDVLGQCLRSAGEIAAIGLNAHGCLTYGLLPRILPGGRAVGQSSCKLRSSMEACSWRTNETARRTGRDRDRRRAAARQGHGARARARRGGGRHQCALLARGGRTHRRRGRGGGRPRAGAPRRCHRRGGGRPDGRRHGGQAFGRVDILVNNAAIRAEAHFLEMTLKQWREILGVILDGAFLCSRAVLPHMVKNKYGRIINLGGVSARISARPGAPMSAPARWASSASPRRSLRSLPRTASRSIAWCRARSAASVRRPPASGIQAVPPVGREGVPDDVAGVVRMLCQPQTATSPGRPPCERRPLYAVGVDRVSSHVASRPPKPTTISPRRPQHDEAIRRVPGALSLRGPARARRARSAPRR